MNILMVCLGNICRSPMAEELLRSKLPSTFQVDSAGNSDYHEGDAPDARAIRVMEMKGYDISKQKSRPLTSSDFKKFDRIYYMEDDNYAKILELNPNPSQLSKIQKITTAAGDEAPKVVDPYFGDEEGFHECFRHLDHLTDILARDLQYEPGQG